MLKEMLVCIYYTVNPKVLSMQTAKLIPLSKMSFITLLKQYECIWRVFETVIELLIFVSLTNLNYQVLPQAILLSCCDWLKAQNKSVLVQVATFEFSEQFKVTLHFACSSDNTSSTCFLHFFFNFELSVIW